MWINIKELEELEGDLLIEFVDGIKENIKDMKETIDMDLKNGSKDINSLNKDQITNIIELYGELKDFFEKLEEFELCNDIVNIINFFKEKNKNKKS